MSKEYEEDDTNIVSDEAGEGTESDADEEDEKIKESDELDEDD